jgi:hypothetical protein
MLVKVSRLVPAKTELIGSAPLRVLLILFVLLLSLPAQAQQRQLSNLRHRILPHCFAPQPLDTQFILPHSVQIQEKTSGRRLDTSWYRVQFNLLLWRVDTAQLQPPFELTYRVLPASISQSFRLLDSSQLRQANSTGGARIAIRNAETLLDFRQLNYSGNFSRGISLGNRQDLVLNSNFNLQLAGDLGDGVQILAAISDESIPIQPEGNTLQLQELDRVFIQLRKKDTQLTAGDYELNRPDGYFMNYYKKLQGATFGQKQKLGEKGNNLSNSASVAVSRGKFARNVITPSEGNQGPYKLRGPNNERFIIVLSGSEKIWLNGTRMQRGQDLDYIVDYNRGEISFTSRHLISRESRIIAEFEYADQNYLRTLVATSTQYQSKNLKAYLNLYQEQDSRTSTGGLSIGEMERMALQLAGDDPAKAITSGLRRQEEFVASRVFYELRDTALACGQRDSVLVFSNNPSKAKYNASFTYLGPNQGHYILAPAQTANERVYLWVPPDPLSCAPRGEYAPVIALSTPQKQRMITVGQSWSPHQNTSLQTEIALSQYDRNRFSRLDQQDDAGWAAFTQFRQRLVLGQAAAAPEMNLRLSYEAVQRNFRTLNPYRNPEFLRDWSLTDFQGQGSVAAANEQIGRLEWGLSKTGLGQINYAFSTFLREQQYQGFRHEVHGEGTWKGWQLKGLLSSLQADAQGEDRRFFRPQVSVDKVFKKLKNWSLGWTMEGEQNDRFTGLRDSLTGSSFRFLGQRVYLKSPSSRKWESGLEYVNRQDTRPIEGLYRPLSKAQEWRWNSKLQLKQAFGLMGNLTYRQLESFQNQANASTGNTLLGRIDLNAALWKGLARANTTYELGSGQEPRLEFTYIRVAPGEGQYIWLDTLFNRDGVIQPNEMEISPFADQANYIRVATITDQYIRNNYVNWNQSLNLDPRARWFNAKTGLKRYLKVLALQASWRVSRKVQDQEQGFNWNPLALNLSDTNLVAASANGRQVLFLNRASPKWEVQLGHTDTRSKLVQTTGFESRALQEYFIQGRWNLNAVLSLKLNLAQGLRGADSEVFNNKDFRLRFQKWEPQLSWQPSAAFRGIFQYRYQKDENTLEQTPTGAQQHDLSADFNYTRASKSALRGKISWVNVDFRGVANSPIGFAILNGLQAGNNWLWNLSLDRQVARNLQLRFSYEGRKTGEAKTVHVGRVMVGAVF